MCKSKASLLVQQDAAYVTHLMYLRYAGTLESTHFIHDSSNEFTTSNILHQIRVHRNCKLANL